MDRRPSFLLLVAALSVLLTQQTDRRVAVQLGVCSASAVAPPDPHYELIEGTVVVWQRPRHELQGVVLAFHGCSHGAVDWWPRDDDCPQCMGLPLEVNITKTVLSRGYALVAISSRDRQYSKCWAVPRHPDSHTVDTRSVTAVLPILLQREQMTGVPVYALGASSGGAFALVLPWYFPLAGVCSQIMALPTDMYEHFLNSPVARTLSAGDGFNAAGVTRNNSEAPIVKSTGAVGMEESGSTAVGALVGGEAVKSPPVLFVHMPRDQHTAQLVAENLEARKQKVGL
eukprot:GHUV01018578.1.p1 GENE.GHUV01018578.1~~GHUV01018578.1.p1  ORF type:complete len:285 (+),score=54.53 GHUV01018578.1:714-1568(+)